MAPAARRASAPCAPSRASSPKRSLQRRRRTSPASTPRREEVDGVIRHYRDAGVTSHRGAARRPGRRHRRALRAASRTATQRRRPGRAAISAHRRLRHLRLGLSGKAPGKPGFRHRHRHAEAQGRQWRDAGDHPVLLRQRPLRAPMSSACAAPASTFRSMPGILPVHNFAQVAEFAARCGAHVPSWLADRFAGLENDPQTRALVAAAVAAEQVHRPHRARREDFPLLHDEPGRPFLRDLPSARPARPPGRWAASGDTRRRLTPGRAGGKGKGRPLAEPPFDQFWHSRRARGPGGTMRQGRMPMTSAPTNTKAAQTSRTFTL